MTQQQKKKAPHGMAEQIAVVDLAKKMEALTDGAGALVSKAAIKLAAILIDLRSDVEAARLIDHFLKVISDPLQFGLDPLEFLR